MSDKATLSNAELELTQRIQMHFPRGVLSAEILKQWNGCPAEIITAVITRAFGTSLELHKPNAVIDCDADPFVPSGWKMEEHKKGGQFVFNPAKVKLHFSPNQQDGKVIEGNKLRKELTNKPVLNACVLDYLLAHPELIPEEWKGEYVFFWGTIYRDSYGDLYVRCLYFRDGGWDWRCHWLDFDWRGGRPAALSAS